MSNIKLQPFQDRVLSELDALQGNLQRLRMFIGGPVFDTMQTEDQDLMIRQMNIMADYADVLQLRINRFKGIAS